MSSTSVVFTRVIPGAWLSYGAHKGVQMNALERKKDPWNPKLIGIAGLNAVVTIALFCNPLFIPILLTHEIQHTHRL